ncbi:hypothetical protein ACQKWADRAFT_267358 [Trichoderma austrokoningii]
MQLFFIVLCFSPHEAVVAFFFPSTYISVLPFKSSPLFNPLYIQLACSSFCPSHYALHNAVSFFSVNPSSISWLLDLVLVRTVDCIACYLEHYSPLLNRELNTPISTSISSIRYKNRWLRVKRNSGQLKVILRLIRQPLHTTSLHLQSFTPMVRNLPNEDHNQTRYRL